MKWALVSIALILPVLASGGSPASAAVCPNEQLREQQAASTTLPDCRAYEQATPVDKNGIAPEVDFRTDRSSPSGDAVTFFSSLPFPVPGEGSFEFPTYLSSRSESGWSIENLVAPTEVRGQATVRAWSEDLSEVVEQVYTPTTPATIELVLRNSTTQAYRRIADLKGNTATVDSVGVDGSVVFETAASLLPDAAAGKSNVYEWNAESDQIGLVGVLPQAEGAVAPVQGSIAGPYEWVENKNTVAGAAHYYYMQNVAAADGSRVFWTATGTGKLFVSEEGISALITTGHWDAASAEGSKVLADNASELAEYTIAHGASGPSVTSTTVAPTGSGIMGVLGMSEDGSYVYFVANAVLAANEGAGASHASTGTCVEQSSTVATCNLYLWHDGTTTFIGHLHTGGTGGVANDWYDWTPTGKILSGPISPRSSRVAPSGMALLFSSAVNQTTYASNGHTELYRYEAPSETHANGNLMCVSCDPAGQPPRVEANAKQEATLEWPTENGFLPGGVSEFVTRNLSSDGSRVFFDSSERLLPQDLAETGVRNVYEWEAVGAGTCQTSSATYSAASSGCLYMLSTGQSSEPSYFVDASATGEDVFIDTSQQLVAQDGDQIYDIYDARVDGGIRAQNERSGSCQGEECLPPLSSPPTSQTPPSQSLSGTGNLAPPAPEAVRPASKPKAKPLTRAQKLKSALKSCRKKEAKKKRRACEANAKRKYGKAAKSAGSARDEGRRGQ